MKHLLMINLYLAVAVFFYMKTSASMAEKIEEREFLSGTFSNPNAKAFYEIFALVLALAWCITIPLLVAHRLARGSR